MSLLRFAVLFMICLGLPMEGWAAIVSLTGQTTYSVTFNNGNFLDADIRGTDVLADTITGDLALFTDGNAPAPNSAMIALAAGDELLSVTFDFASASYGPNFSLVTLLGAGTAVTPVTNSVLTGLVGAQSYRFQLASIVDDRLNFTLVDISSAVAPVPEPGSASMLALAALSIGTGVMIRRRR